MRDAGPREVAEAVLNADDVVKFVAVDAYKQQAYLSDELIAAELGVTENTARLAKKLLLRDHRDELPVS